jgi:hypothetical protein
LCSWPFTNKAEFKAIAGITSLLLGIAGNPEAANRPSLAIWRLPRRFSSDCRNAAVR